MSKNLILIVDTLNPFRGYLETCVEMFGKFKPVTEEMTARVLDRVNRIIASESETLSAIFLHFHSPKINGAKLIHELTPVLINHRVPIYILLDEPSSPNLSDLRTNEHIAGIISRRPDAKDLVQIFRSLPQ